jgi:hypothetical protein
MTRNERILKAIESGKHHTRDIIEATGMELEYEAFCLAMYSLEAAGRIVCNQNGFFLK